MHNLNVVIGVEIHVVVNSITKMFSPAKNCHNDPVNQNIHPIDLALPGTMPTVNKAVVIKALQLAKVLQMKKIDLNVRFDRKNYFYKDLPKGFQITQYYYPIAQDGLIEITDRDGQPKMVKIDHFHMEEDTAKQNKLDDQNTLLDFNRAGSPLFEIVTAPVFTNAAEVKSYLVNLRRYLLALNVSDGRMEDGSMRVDINISLNPVGTNCFGSKVEVKNVNSIANVGRAINYEIERQCSMYLRNSSIQPETRFYDDKRNITVFMRSKANTLDYRYMTEPNIFCIHLSQAFLVKALSNLPALPNEVKQKYVKANLSEDFIELLLDNPSYQKYLALVDQHAHDLKESARWLFVELGGLINKQNIKMEQISSGVFEQIGLIIGHLQAQEINNKQAKQLLEYLVQANGSKNVSELMKEHNYQQLCDEQVIASELTEFIKQYQDHLKDYRSRPERIEKFFIGLLMRKNAGAVNPQVSIKVLRKLIKEHLASA